MEPEALSQEPTQRALEQTPALDNASWMNDAFENTGLELLGEMDMWNQSQWLDTIVTDQGMLSDDMYGLFTPNDINAQGF
jgi:hypothetical protein